MTDGPKELTLPCTIRIPKFMTACCTEVKPDSPAISRSTRPSHFLCSLRGTSSGNRQTVNATSPNPDTYCASTVAPAAPPTPQSSVMTKNRSSTMFKTADTAKNSSGVTESPIARSRFAK